MQEDRYSRESSGEPFPFPVKACQLCLRSCMLCAEGGKGFIVAGKSRIGEFFFKLFERLFRSFDGRFDLGQSLLPGTGLFLALLLLFAALQPFLFGFGL